MIDDSSPVARWRLAVDMTAENLAAYVGDATLAPLIQALENGDARASDPRLAALWREVGDTVRLRQVEWAAKRRCGVTVT